MTNIEIKAAAGDSQKAQKYAALRGPLLFHDNARPHSPAATVEAIRLLKFELLLPRPSPT
jgi:hypothetical protein